MPTTPQTGDEMLKELLGQRCRCGKKKAAGATYCYGCFRRLTGAMQSALYKRFDAGYQEAKRTADEHLDIKRGAIE